MNKTFLDTHLFDNTANIFDVFDEIFLNNVSKCKSVPSMNSCNYPYNIYTDNDSGAIIEIALAGFKRSEIDVSVIDNEVNITASSEQKDDENKKYVQRGIAKRDASMKYKIGSMADASKISSTYEDGLLTITIPHKPKSEFSIKIN